MLNNPIHNRRKPGSRAQAMIEFAIVAPILFLMLLGIIEVGRMIFLYTAVVNASREAVRFGSVIGYDEDGVLKYKHCSKIRDVARQASYFTTLLDTDITINFDHGPGTTALNPSPCAPGVTVAPGYFVKSGDRILVTVTGQYSPFTSLIPWGPRDFSSASARTILGYVAVSSGTGGGSGGGGSAGPTDTPTATEDPYNPWTATPTVTEGPSPTPTATATATNTAVYWTFTPMPTSTGTGTPTRTPSITNTPTTTPSPTSTSTPTSTPTLVPGCNQIVVGNINVVTNTMTMTIRNPHGPLTVSTVQVKWNAATGAAGNKALALQSASLGGLFWNGTNASGNYTITPSTTVTIPGNNTTSTILFTFDGQYKNLSGEAIIITLSNPECAGITIHRP